MVRSMAEGQWYVMPNLTTDLLRIPALLNTQSGDVINSTVDHEQRKAS